jgi:PRTRC genetic system protein B
MREQIPDLTEYFSDFYFPEKALLFYRHATSDTHPVYIEAFDCSKNGRLINAHPLSEKELRTLAALLHEHHQSRDRHWQCDTLLPRNLLFVSAAKKCAIWYTPPGKQQVLFARSLHLCDGTIAVPALIWKATAEELFVYSCKATGLPNENTPLFHAPFFNLYDDGKVCMGTVNIDMQNCTDLHAFIRRWQHYFFNSRFSHIIGERRATRTPLEVLYKALLNTNAAFPSAQLLSMRRQLKDLLP